MLLKSGLKQLPAVVLSVSLLGANSLFLQSGCATSGSQQSDKISSEKQKAVQDSLRKALEFQLLKYMSFGRENSKNNMFGDALPHYWRVVELDTINKFPQVYQYLGECYIKLDKPDSAESVYGKGIAKYPENAHYHRTLGWLLNGKREYEKAVLEYREAIRLDSVARVDDYRALGILLVQLDRRQEALPVYEKLVELQPDDVEALTVLADLYLFIGNEEAALNVREQALAIAPQDTKLLFIQGEAFYKGSEFGKAIEKFEQLLSIIPGDVFALEILGYAYQNSGDPINAIVNYEKVISLKPDHKKVLCEMATSFKDLKKYTTARNVVNKAMKIDAKYGYAYIVLGEIFESAANDCIEKREDKAIRFDDKLVFKFAFEEYEKAKKDPEFAERAEAKMEYIKNDLPTKADYHMHPNQKYPRLNCYKWIR